MVIVILLVCLLAAACGGGSAGPTPPNVPSNPYTFTLTASGVSPKELRVPAGSRVLFVNNDSRRHDMTNDPHPAHDNPGCMAINSVGLLTTGQSRETGNLVDVRTCGFHDHENPPPTEQAGNIWTGRIIVQ